MKANGLSEAEAQKVLKGALAGEFEKFGLEGTQLAHTKVTIEYRPEWNQRDFQRKAKALRDLAERGKLRKSPNPVPRDRTVTATYKDALIHRAYDQYGKSDSAKFNSLRDKIRALQADH